MSIDAPRPNLRDTGRGSWTAGDACAVEARRREILHLLEEIRSDRPSRADVLAAIKRVSNGELTPDHVQRIAGSVLALYK